jgi:hypothetical protein
MPKNTFPSQVRIGVEKRFLIEEQNNSIDENPLDGSRPLSLSAGPTLIWLNAIGDIEAKAIVDEYRPRFRIIRSTDLEHITWQ